MDQLPTPAPTTATEEPAVPATPRSRVPACRVSDRLADPPFGPALDAATDPLARAPRPDGWTPERIRIFLTTLAECGVVGDACRAARISRQAAYAFRNRASGRAFHLAWNAAEQLGRRRLEGEAVSRALHGCVELVVRGDEVIERHRFDNRHTMAVLTRLDQRILAMDAEACTARLVAEEFEQFLDIVCAGGEGAADFVASRLENEPGWRRREASVLERCDNYARYGVGLPEEIDVSDLDRGAQEGWTDEQRERAERSGLLDELGDDEADDEGDGTGLDALLATLAVQAMGGTPGAPRPRVRRPSSPDPSARERGAAPPAEPPVTDVEVPPQDPAAEPARADAEPPPQAPPAEPPVTDVEAPPQVPAAEPPAPVEAREQATCLPEQYDPKSGLLPPDGWVPPRR